MPVDAYVFIREADDVGLERLRALVDDELSPVRFVGSVSGEHDVIVAVSAEDFGSIEMCVKEEIRGQGVGATETAYVIVPVPLPMPKVRPPAEFEAFVRCRVEHGKARAVANALANLDSTMGVAIVAGTFDVLLEVGASSFDDLGEALARMHEVDGLVWTTSALAAFAV